ncbi:MAG: NUDIX domain-containing protein [Bacteroidia bacterium]
MSYTYTYPRPALTVDCVVFGWDGVNLKVLLIQRGEEPFTGQWALPGGFVHIDEELEDAARRELEEETGLRDMYLEQLYTFGGVGRDPRGRVVTVAWYALIDLTRYAEPIGASDAKAAAWFPFTALPPLAFDHDKILATAYKRLQGKISYQPIGFELLPEKFSFTQLQNLYETILGEEFDRRNFRKKMLSMGILMELDEHVKGVPHRAARLYKFDEARYRELENTGLQFKI